MPTSAQITLIGHITAPEFRTVGEHQVASFRLCVNRKRKDVEIATWFGITCWRRDADYVQKYLQKGALVMVQGETWAEEYEGKTYLKVDASKVMGLGSKPKGAEPEASPAKPGLPVGRFNPDEGSEPPF